MKFLVTLSTYISKLIGIYSFAIIVRILLSWLPMSYNNDRPVLNFLKAITDPFLNIFRSKKLTIGRIDFSTIIALMVLNIAKTVFMVFAQTQQISFGMIILILIYNVWNYLIKFFAQLFIILLLIRWFMGRSPNPNYSWITALDAILKRPVDFVFRLFYPHASVSEQKLVGTALIFYGLAYLVIACLLKTWLPL